MQQYQAWIFSLVLHSLMLVFLLTGFVSFDVDSGMLLNRPEQERIVVAKAVSADEIEAMLEQKAAHEKKLRDIAEQEARAKKAAEERQRKAALQKKQEQIKAEQLRKEKLERSKREVVLKQEKERQAKEKQQREQALRLELERKEKEAERQREEAARLAREEEMRRKEEILLREREAAAQKRLLRWQSQYVSDIRRSIERQWRKPPASVAGGDCIVKIRQDEKGNLLKVKVLSCKGDRFYQRSVEEAVYKAAPLPLPPSSEVFSNEIELVFRQKY